MKGERSEYDIDYSFQNSGMLKFFHPTPHTGILFTADGPVSNANSAKESLVIVADDMAIDEQKENVKQTNKMNSKN